MVAGKLTWEYHPDLWNLELYLQMKSIDKPSVYIRDSVGVRDKLRKLYESGPEKLQVFNEHGAVIALAWSPNQ